MAGRKRDEARNAVILDAAVAVLAEQGYEGMTIDMVAARAGMARATVYRRWATKADLVLDARNVKLLRLLRIHQRVTHRDHAARRMRDQRE